MIRRAIFVIVLAVGVAAIAVAEETSEAAVELDRMERFAELENLLVGAEKKPGETEYVAEPASDEVARILAEAEAAEQTDEPAE